MAVESDSALGGGWGYLHRHKTGNSACCHAENNRDAALKSDGARALGHVEEEEEEEEERGGQRKEEGGSEQVVAASLLTSHTGQWALLFQ